MIKEQIIILKVRYDDSQEKSPHTWDWTGIIGNDRQAEVLNHGATEDAKKSD
jgi:hypothetical protein